MRWTAGLLLLLSLLVAKSSAFIFHHHQYVKKDYSCSDIKHEWLRKHCCKYHSCPSPTPKPAVVAAAKQDTVAAGKKDIVTAPVATCASPPCGPPVTKVYVSAPDAKLKVMVPKGAAGADVLVSTDESNIVVDVPTLDDEPGMTTKKVNIISKGPPPAAAGIPKGPTPAPPAAAPKPMTTAAPVTAPKAGAMPVGTAGVAPPPAKP